MRILAAVVAAVFVAALTTEAVGAQGSKGQGQGPSAGTPAAAKGPRSAPSDLLPIIFVHGQSGSAQQFETQALRFTSNGYPQHLLYAWEYDTSVSTNDLQALDAFVDAVLAETGAEQVYAIGHSRGTTVWTSYLFPDEGGIDGSGKVAKYVNIDGRRPAELPGGVPTIGIWGEWNTANSGFNRIGNINAQIGPNPNDNFHFADKSHTEVATSPEAFAHMFRFLTGNDPVTTDVVPEPPGQVTIAGRAVLFPQNAGYEGATVSVWRVDPATGQRVGSQPRAAVLVDASGNFGPIRVNGQHHYELSISRPEVGTSEHHFYFEPFARSNHFVRLQTSPPGEGIAAFIPTSDQSTNFVLLRMREYWGDQGASSDVLAIDGLNILQPNISPRSAVNLVAFAFDDGLDGVTDLGKGVLFPFNLLSFLTAADVFTPASPGGDGVVNLALTTRGGPTTEINVPNFPSSEHGVTVQFRDYSQSASAFTDYPRGAGR
jgi:pimeloyl-ACP methyl ester carboxylesterase